MNILPILKSLLRNRTGTLLVVLQVAVLLSIVVNALFIVVKRAEFINRPNGMDVENILVYRAQGFGDQYNHNRTVDEDLALLRSLPGVVSASLISAPPLSGYGSNAYYYREPDLSDTFSYAAYYYVDEHIVESLGLTLKAGRTFKSTELVYQTPTNLSANATQVLITEKLAKSIFGEDDALGQLMYDPLGRGSEIVGIIDTMHAGWPNWPQVENVVVRPTVIFDDTVNYVIRTKPGERDRVQAAIEPALRELNRTRVQTHLSPLADIVKLTYEADHSMVKILSVSIALIIIVSALGIVGLASGNVRQRTKQIGTRRALGATKWNILSYFLTENWLMTTLGIILGAGLTLLLNQFLVTQFEVPPLSLPYLGIGLLVVWAMGLLAVLGPALRATSISPAIATRTV